MTRFVALSFLFLGWAFWELSGGADFQPPERPVAVAEAPASEPASAAPAPRTTRRAQPAEAPPVVARATVQPASPAVQEEAVADAQVQPVALQRIDTGFTFVDQDASAPAGPADTGGEGSTDLARLFEGFGTATLAVDEEPARAEAPPPADIREVTGTRVNMRDGPGTIYPVIARLDIGHEVEVLSDSGTGWLRLRTLPDLRIGWISASLVSDAAN